MLKRNRNRIRGSGFLKQGEFGEGRRIVEPSKRKRGSVNQAETRGGTPFGITWAPGIKIDDAVFLFQDGHVGVAENQDVPSFHQNDVASEEISVNQIDPARAEVEDPAVLHHLKMEDGLIGPRIAIALYAYDFRAVFIEEIGNTRGIVIRGNGVPRA